MPKKYQPDLTEENLQFCESVAEFCEVHNITGRKFSRMCNGSKHRFQPALANYFLRSMVTDAVVDRMRPIIAPAFVQFLEDAGYPASEIEAELSTIFDPKEFMKMIANRSTLSPEAVRFFGLSDDPFDVDRLPAADQLFTMPELDDVARRVSDAILYQKFLAVVGDVGSGKTLLKLRIAHELSELQDVKVHLLYPEFFDMGEVSVAAIASQILLEIKQSIPRDKNARVLRIKEVLTQLHQEDVKVALVMDECHRLSDKVISSLKNFWELNNGAFSRLLGVVLFGQPSFVDSRLREVKFKEIRQRVQIVKMPKTQDIGRDYLDHRLKICGGDLDSLFEPLAVEKICANAETFLALGNLANEALTEAYKNQEQRVSASFTFFKKLGSGNQVLGVRNRAA